MALTEAQLAKMVNLKALQSLANRTDAVTDDLQNQIDNINDAVIKGVKVNGTALTPVGNVVDVLATMEKLATAESGFASSYQMKVNGVAVGDKINIAKDYVVKSATLLTSTAENYQTIGTSAAGKKYIDFVINTKVDGDSAAVSDTHIYLPVEDLVDVYLAGNGLELDANNTFSIKLESGNTNGLTVGANGLGLNTVTAASNGTGGANGAMLATDKERLDAMSDQANKTTVGTEGSGAIEIDGVSKAVVYIATDDEVSEMLDTSLPAPAAGE